MSRVFFTSDLHFGHKNLIEGLRGMTVEENDNLIIKNWNKTVSKKDTVYILGDLTMDKPKLIGINLSKLNGYKIIVAGNHDSKRCCDELARLGYSIVGCITYKGYILSHIPIAKDECDRFRGNIHGHIHLSGNIEGLGDYEGIKLDNSYYNVNTEFHNYTPVLFNDIDKHFITCKTSN